MKSNHIHICTLNTKGLQQSEKRKRISEWSSQQKCDILLMQETHFTKNLESKVHNDFTGQIFFSNGVSNARGVAILIKTLNFKIIDEHKDLEGRLLLVNGEINESILTIVNVYAPNNKKERNSFFKKVKTFVSEKSLGQIILGGDFNDILSERDTKCRKLGKKSTNPVNSLKNVIKSLKLVDIWRDLNKTKTQFTWSRKNRSESTRIDYFLVSPEIRKNCSSCDIRPIVSKLTDHNCVSMKINLNRGDKGRGYWKLNTSVLKDEGYIKKITSLIKEYKIKAVDYNDLRILWDNFKIEVRDFTINHCKINAKIKKQSLQMLEEKLKLLNQKVDNIPRQNTKHEIIREISIVENQIDNIYSQKIKGNQIRSRVKWIEKGEKNTSFFLGLEKTRQSKKTITQLYDDNGNITNDQEKILLLEVNYYKNLYSSTNPDTSEIKKYIEKVNCPKLSKSDSDLCGGELTIDECTNAIFKMKLNRSPGLDGLNVEFYRAFWHELKTLIVPVFNYCYKMGELTNSQKIGAISLLYKKNDPLTLDNYRPITLLNYDLKLMAYALAQRLKNVLPKIIHSDQKGYVKNRYIGFNVRQIQDVIDYCEKFNVDGAILFLDFTKAFDSLEWDFLFETLQKFGFHHNFIKWVQTMYTDIKSCILNNGWVSSPVKIFRGIRQGCPISSLLFVLAVEIMATELRDNKNLKGIQVKLDGKDCSLKICQLADDTTLFLKSRQDISIALNIIEIFGNMSGLKLNKNKTEGIWLGKQKHSRDKFENIKWCSKPIKSLGFYFGYNSIECQNMNIEKQLNKCEKLISDWNKRHITMIGKIVIIKSLLLPNIIYIASCSIIPQEKLQLFKNMIYEFIWKGKTDRIKRTTLSKDYNEGGLRMIDIDLFIKSIHIRWITRLCENTNENWKTFPMFHFNKFGKNLLVFRMNLNSIKNLNTKTLKTLPEFYQQLIKTWISVKKGDTIEPKTFYDIRKQVIWGNEYIKLNRKCLFFNNWIKSDILYINDLLDEKGYISEDQILRKLNIKSNWIAEMSELKKAIPKHWLNIIKMECSYKTKININPKINLQIKNTKINASTSNKEIYELLRGKFNGEKPLGFMVWEKRLPNMNHSHLLQSTCQFIFEYLEDNRLKMFRYKLIHYILPCGDQLYKWKISSSDLCPVCNVKDDYEHFFISCKLNKCFLNKINNLLKFLHINNQILTLKNAVVGYKIDDFHYYEINHLLTFVFFSIYKAFCVSNNRTSAINIFIIFKQELKQCVETYKFVHKTHNLLFKSHQFVKDLS